MSLEYRVDRARRLVWARATGVLTPGELFGYQRAVMALPEISGYSQLVDVSGVTMILEPTPDHMRSLALAATAVDDAASDAKLVMVAPSDLLFALSRQYEMYRSMNPHSVRATHVVRTFEDACAYLGVDGAVWEECERF